MCLPVILSCMSMSHSASLNLIWSQLAGTSSLEFLQLPIQLRDLRNDQKAQENIAKHSKTQFFMFFVSVFFLLFLQLYICIYVYEEQEKEIGTYASLHVARFPFLLGQVLIMGSHAAPSAAYELCRSTAKKGTVPQVGKKMRTLVQGLVIRSL